MKARLERFASTVLTLALATAAHAAPPPADIAMQVLDRLDAGQYDAASEPFSERMRQAAPPAALKQVWSTLPPSRGRGTPEVTQVDGATQVEIPLHREGLELVARLHVLPDGHVAGFAVQPAKAPPAPPPPADAPYTERDTTVGTGADALPATLAMPRGDGRVPAVVLVHGSGPNDRDESIGANRPFLDIARGLAARGIAVLRYEKRTRAHPEQFAHRDFTVDDEATNDAVAAVELLRATPGIDASRVFVLGHSQGGLLAPRIAKASGHVAGLVMLAAPGRRLLDLLPDQNRYLAQLDGRVSDEEKAAIAQVDAMIAGIRGGKAMDASQLPLGLPMAYWRSVDAIDPVADARAMRVPLLLMQGGRDFQVTAPDWAAWQAALGHDARATLKFYPALDHLGIAGTGPSSLQSYSTPGHVDGTLLDDLAAWIKARH